MKKFNITVNGTAYEVEVEEVKAAGAAPAAGESAVNAPMPGKVIKLVASVGQAVKAGEVVLILEAMKMQNEIVAPVDGSVKAINVAAGQAVQAGEVLAVIG